MIFAKKFHDYEKYNLNSRFLSTNGCLIKVREDKFWKGDKLQQLPLCKSFSPLTVLLSPPSISQSFFIQFLPKFVSCRPQSSQLCQSMSLLALSQPFLIRFLSKFVNPCRSLFPLPSQLCQTSKCLSPPILLKFVPPAKVCPPCQSLSKSFRRCFSSQSNSPIWFTSLVIWTLDEG